MERLHQLVGNERSLTEVAQALHFSALSLSPGTVGAMLVTCADESEYECVEAFHRGLVQYLLPSFKFARRSALRLANLGGRYEWGAIRTAEQHFSAAAPRDTFTLMLIKINAHVACEDLGVSRGPSALGELRFGTWKRYDTDSPCCGALTALLKGADEPYATDLREAFRSESRDRLATLLNEQEVDSRHRLLFAAMVSARLQARKAVLDIQDYVPVNPTCFLVMPCVTLNRHGRDSEIVCGLYSIDGREGGSDATYFGLEDDPAAYKVDMRNGRLSVSDEDSASVRTGRDHRLLARQAWERQAASTAEVLEDERLQRTRRDVERNLHRQHHHAKMLLRTALPVLAQLAPVPVALLMFAEGAVGIHHAFRIHHLMQELEDSDEAVAILDEIHDSIDSLEPDRAEALIELLMQEFRSS